MKNMKKAVTLILTLLLVFCLVGCNVLVETDKNFTTTTSPVLVSIPGKEYLFYDPDTQIVYLSYQSPSLYQGYLSAYYAPNGLPYLYDIETGTLKEIHN